MTEPRRYGRVRLLALVVVLELLLGLAAAVSLRDGPSPRSVGADRARSSPQTDEGRTTAVRQLLEERAQAVRRRDRAAFLQSLDPAPAAKAFRARQELAFAGLAKLAFASFTYRLDDTQERVPDARVDAVRGSGWWSPDVVLRYAIRGFDTRPTRAEQYFTFVLRDGRWRIAADDDFKAVGQASTPGIWDGGRLVVVRGRRSLVLGHPSSGRLLDQVAAAVDAAVPRVSAVFGRGWGERVVVLVPDSSAELAELLDTRSDFSQIAAVATAELEDVEDYSPVGDRIIVNPPNFAKLGPLGRRVVLTHEVTHVATRAATGPYVPTWLVEGFADYVGYQGVDLPLSVSARQLRTALRAGRVPERLPADTDFDATNPELGQVYEQAWLAVVHLARRHGRAAVLAFYRDLGRARSGEEERVVERAFRKAFGRSRADFTRDWVAELRASLQ